jgi:PD-(D/E)XK nuclease superfamily
MSEQLATFFGALGNVARVAADTQRRLDRELATNFSVTKLFRPDENRLSDAIACLLNPSEADGQDSRFLDLFIKMFIKIPCTIDLTRCHVAREQGHLDILVEIGFGKPFAIGIENKPWAGSRPNQVRDYCNYLENQFSEQWWFGYLSGNGRPPPDHSICDNTRKDHERKGRFRTIPFARSHRADESSIEDCSIEDWLALCVKECMAERVRWFLRTAVLFSRVEPRREHLAVPAPEPSRQPRLQKLYRYR